MSLLAAHLEQISISCQGIDSLPFPPPKIFTTALLSNHDITSLIRDTEAHERALFSVPPPPPPATKTPQPSEQSKSSRRQTVFNVAAGEVTTGPPPSRSAGNPRRSTAVAAVLGGDLHAEITRRAPTNRGEAPGAGGDVDIELLLRGAEKLCNVYPLPGALERVPVLRQKWANQGNTLAYYEAKVAEQAGRLGRMNKRVDEFSGREGEEDEEEDDVDVDIAITDSLMTEEDVRREEEEVRELDKKKRELQERLRAINEDLGGLLNM